MALRGIRGAITVSDNTENSIKEATIEIIEAMVKENNIEKEDIASCIFSVTSDITKAYPAKFARLFCGFEYVPLMSTVEQEVTNSLKMAIRVLFLVNTEKKQSEIKHQYLKGAKVLRPDIKYD